MRYGDYSSTDIPWINEMPAHWSCVRGKKIFTNPKEKNENNKENNLLSLTLNGVIRNSKDKPIGLSPADYATYQIFEKDDLVFKMIDLENISTSRVGLVLERGIMSSAYIRFSARSSVNIRYFYLQYYSWWLRNIYNGLGAGVRQTLSAEDLINLKILIPPREEQDQIVRYLDWKVSQINKLIHGYQKQIKLLEEQKITVINNAVVHGIDSNTESSLTKAEWMGSVPVSWRVMRMKNLFTEINVRSKEGKEPHLSMSQKKGLVTDDENINRPFLSESYAGAKICEKDDLVLNRLKAHLGVFALAPIQGIVSPDYTVLRLNQHIVIPKYAEYLLKSNDCRKELRTRVRGIVEGFWRLYTEDLYAIPVCVPSLEEQSAILEYIYNQCGVIDDAIVTTNRQIDLLREYRTRLISDVVTGQIDVRGVQIPDYIPEEDVPENEEDSEEEIEEETENDGD